MGIKQFHLVCTFIIRCFFSFCSKCFEKSQGMVVILPLVHMGFLQLMFSSLKQIILDQSRQNGFHLVCTFIIWCLFLIWHKRSENSLLILPLIRIGDITKWTFSNLKQIILVQSRQNEYEKRYQAVPAFPYCKQRKAGRGRNKTNETSCVCVDIHLWI